MFSTRNSHKEASVLNSLNEKVKSSSSVKQKHPQTEQESKFRRSTLAQFKVAGACYILSLACGMSVSHSSTLIRDLTSNQSSVPIDKSTSFWIAQTQLIAVPIGCLLGGICMDHWGRKNIILACSGCFVLGLWLISGAQNNGMIFAGQTINGLCCGSIITIIMVIIVECTDATIRGPLMTGSHIFIILGSVLAYALALVLNWRAVLGVTSILPLLAIVTFYFQKESAVWLTRKFRMIEARRSLLWIYGPGKEHQAEIVHEEMVRRRRTEEIENFQRFAGYTNSAFGAAAVKYWKIYTTSHILTPFLICLVFNAIHIFFGTFVFVGLAVHTFNYKESNEGADKHSVLLLAHVLRLPGLLASTVLLHWLHRRSLLISSGIASAIFSLTIGIVVYLSRPAPSQTERWVIIILIVFFVTSDSWGFYILTVISTAELIPGETRGILCGFVYAVNGILLCIIISANEEIFDVIATHQLFWIFTIFCLVCTVYVYLFLPETRGKTLANIEDYFRTCSGLWVLRHYKQSHRTRVEINLNEMTVFNKEQQV